MICDAIYIRKKSYFLNIYFLCEIFQFVALTGVWVVGPTIGDARGGDPRRPCQEAAVVVVVVSRDARATDAEHGAATGRVRRRQTPGDSGNRDQDDAHT